MIPLRPASSAAVLGRLVVRVRVMVMVVLAAVSASPVQAERVRLDGVAALVGGNAAGPGIDVVLRSDVELRARLQQLEEGAELPLPPLPDATLAATLNLIVSEHIIAREARRLQVVRATAADVTVERGRLIAAAGGAERVQRLFEALGAKLDELDVIAGRRALVGAFLSANLEGGAVASGELSRWVTQLRARTPLQIYATW